MGLPSTTVRVKVRKLDLSLNLDEYRDDDVAVETPIEIVLNGESIVALYATPFQVEELATGFLLDEGILESKDDLINVRSIGRTVDVEARTNKVHLDDWKSFRTILTSCGSAVDFSRFPAKLVFPSLSNDYRIGADNISSMISELSRSSLGFRRTGALHSAAMFHENSMKTFAEDVGRHNAIDKVIGSSLRQNLDLKRAVLVTTGRQPADMVLKVARVGIPISVSMRGPIHSGILAAERVGLTLVCFARGPRMNVYTFPERVLFSSHETAS